uniref:Myosin N-terminal SH3-like domain-containing protein n=1 Tax=Anopheles atroparvus TaxID=41427 RepID=A0A182JFL7_ANOAO
MAEDLRDRNDPELKYLSVERNSFNDPATQAEWTQKRLVWVPHDSQDHAIPVQAFFQLFIFYLHRSLLWSCMSVDDGARLACTASTHHYTCKKLLFCVCGWLT